MATSVKKYSVKEILAMARNGRALDQYVGPPDNINLINWFQQVGFVENEDPGNKQYCLDGHSILVGTEGYPIEFTFDENGKFVSIYSGE